MESQLRAAKLQRVIAIAERLELIDSIYGITAEEREVLEVMRNSNQQEEENF